MPALLHRQALEPPLVQRPGAAGAVGGVITLGVRHRQPADELRQRVVLVRSKHQVPVVGHDDPSQHVRRRPPLLGLPRHRLLEHAAEGQIVASVSNKVIRPAARLSTW
jgi:hypothetical protein